MTPGTGRSQAFAAQWRGIVVPRALRRPLRVAGRIMSGDFAVPRQFGVIATAALFAATGMYGSMLGGHGPAIVKSVTAASGFGIDEIFITGNSETSEIDVLGQIGLDGGTSLIGFDTQTARERIAELPWVKQANVRKVYPDTLHVDIEERQAFAVWQQGRQLSLIDKDGYPITRFSDGKFAGLPLVVGYGAAERASDFVAAVNRYPQIAGRVTGYIRVADRRWDLRLENGMTIRLPENHATQALARIVELDGAHGLLTRDVTVIDMRVDDRLVLKLSEEAATSRNATIEKRMKPKSKGKRI